VVSQESKLSMQEINKRKIVNVWEQIWYVEKYSIATPVGKSTKTLSNNYKGGRGLRRLYY
jgi:hypothetical protein